MNRTVSTPVHPVSAPATPGVPLRVLAAAGRGFLYCAALLPLGVAALVAAPLGAARAVVGWWRGLRTGLLARPPVPPGRPAVAAVVGHGAASVLLGAAAAPALGVLALVVARGVLYGLVDRGPYTTSWGGPTRAGAWAAHVLVGVPAAVAALAALVGIAAVHQRLTRALDGGRPAGWVIPLTLTLSALGVILVVAWTRQL
jgi:hypothetical protein